MKKQIVTFMKTRARRCSSRYASASASAPSPSGRSAPSASRHFAVGPGPDSVAIGDFNGDHKSDLAVANLFSHTISVLLGEGDGTFGMATNFAAGTSPTSVAVGDLNRDGKPDLAVADPIAPNGPGPTNQMPSGHVSILLGRVTGPSERGPSSPSAGERAPIPAPVPQRWRSAT